MDANETITALLKNKTIANEIYPEDIALAAKLQDELGDDAPNWVRMLAGANDEVFDNPDLFAALLDEVKAALQE